MNAFKTTSQIEIANTGIDVQPETAQRINFF
uniref:Uncharacterized protein n=1 Tax=Moniliophthora roreri TaxID=221103 RepID=A0A0W0FWV1_MONRR